MRKHSIHTLYRSEERQIESRPHLGHCLKPGVQCVTRHAQVRLVKLVLLGPSERRVAEPLLDDGMEPGQQEVDPGPLMGLL